MILTVTSPLKMILNSTPRRLNLCANKHKLDFRIDKLAKYCVYAAWQFRLWLGGCPNTFIYVRQFGMLIYFHLPTRRVPRRPIDLYCQLLMHKLMIMCARQTKMPDKCFQIFTHISVEKARFAVESLRAMSSRASCLHRDYNHWPQLTSLHWFLVYPMNSVSIKQQQHLK